MKTQNTSNSLHLCLPLCPWVGFVLTTFYLQQHLRGNNIEIPPFLLLPPFDVL